MPDQHSSSTHEVEIELERLYGLRPPEPPSEPSLTLKAGLYAYVLFVMPGVLAMMAALVFLVAPAIGWLDTAVWHWSTNRDALIYAGQAVPWSSRKGVEQLVELALDVPFFITLAVSGALWSFALPFAGLKLWLAIVDAVSGRKRLT